MRERSDSDEILDVLTDVAIASASEGCVGVGPALTKAAQAMVPRLAEACVVQLAVDGEAGLVLFALVPPDHGLKPEAYAAAQRCSLLENAPKLMHAGGASALVSPAHAAGAAVGLVTLVSRVHAYSDWSPQIVRALGSMLGGVAERARLRWDLDGQRERLQAAMTARDEFLAVACHELNTPLTALTLQLQSMQRRGGAPDAARVDAAARQVCRLNKLVGELLDVAHLRDDSVRLEPETFDLAALVREVAGRLAAELVRSGSSLELRVDGPCIGAWDRMRVEQAFTSLLSNAIKYGLGNPIDVSLSSEGGIARVSVHDHGIGIAPADQERIFERFERVVRSDHYSGLGLGLWSARRVIEASGGKVLVYSSRESGSTFTMELPGCRQAEVSAALGA